jgi:anthranilate synthase component 1
MVRFFERLPDDTADDLNLPDSVLFFTDTLLVFDHVRHRIQVVSNAHIEGPDEVALRAAYDEAISKIDALVDMLHQPLTLPVDASDGSSAVEVVSNTTPEEFEDAVRKAKEYVYAGDVVQVVLSQRFRTKLSADPINVYRALRSLNPSPFMYYIKCDECRIIGSSPEVFVRCEGGDVELRPIAGTRPRGDTPEEDAALAEELLADEKERAEHVMLVDLGRNDVGRVCDYGTVRVADFMVIERYSHVMHIVSDVVGRLRADRDTFDVVEASFPAGTLSGAPKVRAMEIIEELEPTKRGPYGGAIGYFSFSGNLGTCITIRTLVLVGDDAYVQAGAGIVADSVPEREYEETCNKARAVLAAIERAEAGLD